MLKDGKITFLFPDSSGRATNRRKRFILNLKNFYMHLPKFNYLQQMDILLRMESALAGEGNMVVMCLKQAILTKQPTNLIIRTTKEMIADNYNAIADILGIKLTDTIKNFEL